MNQLLALCFFLVFLLLSKTTGKNRSFSTPDLAPAIKKSCEGFSLFISLWEFSIEMDSQLPEQRTTFLEPKTLLIPGDFAMAHLVPQDAYHPLFLRDQKYEQLRLEFILDHLILESIKMKDLEIGISAGTLSGKPILIRKDPNGDITVNGVEVQKMFSVNEGPDTYRIFILKRPLFDQAEKVRRAFEEYHQIENDAPIGPPLEIPKSSAARGPPTPPRGVVRPAGPPAPPPTHGKISPPGFLPPAPTSTV